jgi:cell division cycle 2-like protein
MWSVGCIFAEILLKGLLFIGKNELTQLEKIFSVLGANHK